MGALSEFLESIELSRLVDTFGAEDLDLDDLGELTDADFKALGVSLGQRNRIRRALGSGPGQAPRTGRAVSPGSTIGPSATAFDAGAPPLDALATLLQPGREVGRFRLVRSLGRGGFAEVWLAEHPAGEEQVALKIVRTGATKASVAVRSLKQEFKVRAKVRDARHLLTIQEPSTERCAGHELVVMPMELARGTLRDWLDERAGRARSEWIEEALDLFDQACRGVEAIHAAGLVHLDLKPENLLIVDDTLKVADLGLSRDLGRISAAASMLLADGVGSPIYMAPEQVLAARPEDVEAAADVWALGVILYELLDGKPPISGRSADLVRRKIADRSLRISFRRIPKEYRGLLKSALMRDEEQRIGSVAELRRALGEIRVERARARLGAVVTDYKEARARWAAVSPTPDPDGSSSTPEAGDAERAREAEARGDWPAAVAALHRSTALLEETTAELWAEHGRLAAAREVRQAALRKVGGAEVRLQALEDRLRREPDPEAEAEAAALRKELADRYLAKLGPLQQIPFLRATDASILELSLDPIGGFLISQIDGEITLGELLTILGTFDPIRVLSSLHFFLDNGIIELRFVPVATLLERAAVHRSERHLAQAIEAYDDVLEQEPEQYEATVGRGVCLLEGKRYDEARESFERAEQLEPRRAAGALGQAEVDFHRKGFASAVHHYTRAIELDPGLAQAWCNRGLSRYYQGQFERSYADLVHARDLEPNLPNIDKYLALVQRKLPERGV